MEQALDGVPAEFFQQELLPPTTLYLIRHGEPEEKYLNCYYGCMDVPLSEKGKSQSRAVVDRLRGVPFDAIYASDLERAWHLAELLGDAHGLPVRRIAAFRERSMGVLQGFTAEEMERDHAAEYLPWRANRVYHRVSEAENFEDVQARVIPAVEELVRSFRGRRICVVAHAGPIRVILAHALGLPLDHVYRLAIDHCSINVVEFPGKDSPRVTLLNG